MQNQHDAFELNLLNSWLDSAEIGLLVLDDTSTVVVLNQTASRFLQVDALKTINGPMTRALAHVDNAGVALNWVMSSNVKSQHQVTVSDASNGKTRHLQLRMTMNETQGRIFRNVSIADVSELLAAKEDLEALRRQWQALNAGVVVVDATQPDLPIVFVNEAFLAMTGYASQEILGRNCRFLQGQDSEQEGLKMIRKAVLAKTNGYAVLRNYRKDGSLFYNELLISPVRNADHVVTHFVGVQHLRDESYKDVRGWVGDKQAMGL